MFGGNRERWIAGSLCISSGASWTFLGSGKLMIKHHISICHYVSSKRQKSIYGKGKGKAIPLQAWTGPEGSRRVRLPDFKTVGT